MIHRILLFIITNIVLATTGITREVDRLTAEQVAKNFYYERLTIKTQPSLEEIKANLAFTRIENNQAIYYAFNLQDKGFVVVAADDRVVPVLCYSFEGNWITSTGQTNFSALMDNYCSQIIYTREYKMEATDEIRSEWKRLTAKDSAGLLNLKNTRSVEPLMVSSWHQTGLYSALCPADSTVISGHAPAGCVATAMAELMYYYRWPTTGVGSNGYTCSYGYLSADFGATTYQWNEMLNSLSESNQAVATLISHCGISVNMNYAPLGSGASSEDALSALITFFRYSSFADLVYKDDFSNADWISLLKEQLDARKPLYYGGQGSIAGHAFNCDGYQDADFFHFNWGLGGAYNGYFYVTSLNPGSMNFTNHQKAIIDLVPEGNYPLNCSGTTTLTHQDGTIEDGSGSFDYLNNTDCYYLIDPLTDPDDSISHIIICFNRFNTEPLHDILTIYDGSTVNSPVLGTYSGSTFPPFVISGGNKILLHFITNDSVQRNGWFITYKSKRPVYCNTLEEFTSAADTIEDGSGVKNYTNNSTCRWLIHPTNAQLINLVFDQFSLENGGDKLEVYDYDMLSGNGNLLGNFTGDNLPPNLSASTGAILMIFTTNDSIVKQGWKAHYTSLPIGIKENSIVQDLSIFPNPANQYVEISFSTGCSFPCKIDLISTCGIVVKSTWVEPLSGIFSQRINLENISKGIYFIRLNTCKGQVMRKLVVLSN